MFKDYITILVGTLQRIHRQYVRYESALDNTLIGIENLNSVYLTHHILDPKILAKYLEAVEDDLEETVSEFEPVYTSIMVIHKVIQMALSIAPIFVEATSDNLSECEIMGGGDE